MLFDAPHPPVQPPARTTIPGPRLPGFGTGKANRERHERSRYWYSRNHDGGRVILHHRHIRPVLIRPWSAAMDGIEATIWASASLHGPAAHRPTECDSRAEQPEPLERPLDLTHRR